MKRAIAGVVVVLSLAAVVQATPLPVLIDQSQSSVTVQLCIAGRCDTDSSPVSGQAWIKVSPTFSPASVTLYDFQFTLTNNMHFYISWGFLGSITADSSNMSMYYPTPFIPLPPATVVDGAFTYSGVPYNSNGTVAYHATGVPCAALNAAGWPCDDSMNLVEQGTQYGDMNGTIIVSDGRVVTFVTNLDFSGPIDPENPDLGTISISGTIRGSATLPLRGDANLDGVVDSRDIQDFVSILLNSGGSSWQQRFAVDMDDNDVFDANDATVLVDCLLNANCPE